MDATQFADLMGTLATAATVFVVFTAVLRVASPKTFSRLRDAMAGYGAGFGAVVAATCMAGSLWFSEIAEFPPCELCWYQRIAMYPLVLLLGLAAVRRDRSIAPYGIALAAAGLLVSTWHVLVEIRPSLETGSCDPANPCSIRWVEGLGFWTIPRMAAAGFVLIIALLLIDRVSSVARSPEVPSVPTKTTQ